MPNPALPAHPATAGAPRRLDRLVTALQLAQKAGNPLASDHRSPVESPIERLARRLGHQQAVVAGPRRGRPSAAAGGLARMVVLVAGASPTMAPLQHQTWETFSANWHADVQIAFHWIQAALTQPLAAGSRIIVISSGAALAGSPLSGGYAGAKATQRFIAGYAQDEANRAGLDLIFTTVFPRPSPVTDVGRAAVQAYSAREGLSEAAYVQRLGGILTPQVAGRALIELRRADVATLAPGYLLTGGGLQPMGASANGGRPAPVPVGAAVPAPA